MAANHTAPNGIASYAVTSTGAASGKTRTDNKGPYPARITDRRVKVNGYTFDRATCQRTDAGAGVGRFRLLSFTLTPKD